MNWRRPASCARTLDRAALRLVGVVLSMHCCRVLPGANCSQADFSDARLRARSASPAALSWSSGMSTRSVACSIFANFSAPSAKSCVACGFCAFSQSAISCVAFTAAALLAFNRA